MVKGDFLILTIIRNPGFTKVSDSFERGEYLRRLIQKHTDLKTV